MSYKVQIRPAVRRKIASWGLPDFLIVDIYLRLAEDLPKRPLERFRRTRRPYDGMEYRFGLIDPANRLCEYVCAFQVVYAQDEETLVVVINPATKIIKNQEQLEAAGSTRYGNGQSHVGGLKMAWD